VDRKILDKANIQEWAPAFLLVRSGKRKNLLFELSNVEFLSSDAALGKLIRRQESGKRTPAG